MQQAESLARELAEMTQERDELRQIILETPAVFGISKGKDHVLTLVNQMWTDLTRKENVIGMPYRDAFPEQAGTGMYEMLDGIFQTGAPVISAKLPVELDRGNGKIERRYVAMRNFALRDKDGNPTGIVCYADDVTAETVAAEQTAAVTAKLRTFFLLAENAPDGIIVTRDGKIEYANPAFLHMLDRTELVGVQHAELLALESRQTLADLLSQAEGYRGTLVYKRHDDITVYAQVSAISLPVDEGKSQAQGFIIRDMTEQRRMEREQRALQEQVIAAQERAIQELSTPLIPLAEGLVLMPLVGEISTARVEQMMETLLQGIATQQARIAILDITGAKRIDTQVANALLRTAHAVRLLGADVVLSGIGPEIARTLVGIGTDLSTMKTRSTLASAVTYAMSTPRLSNPPRKPR